MEAIGMGSKVAVGGTDCVVIGEGTFHRKGLLPGSLDRVPVLVVRCDGADPRIIRLVGNEPIYDLYKENLS